MYDVLLRIRSGSGMHMTPGVMCGATYQLHEEHYTGDCVQSVDLLHAGGTKQPGPGHAGHHHGREHRALVSCSTYETITDESDFKKMHMNIINLKSAKLSQMTRLAGIVCQHKGPSSTR
jgi:hypothetical protein